LKKFLVTQHFDAPAEVVADAFRSEDTWRAFAGLPFVGDPVVQSCSGGQPGSSGTFQVDTAYRVSIDLPSLAHKFIDPAKLTFVESTELAADGSGAFRITPDYYKKLLKASGTIDLVPVDRDSCERQIHGSVDVSLGWSGVLFEGPVEDAIVNGLSKALKAQAAQVLP